MGNLKDNRWLIVALLILSTCVFLAQSKFGFAPLATHSKDWSSTPPLVVNTPPQRPPLPPQVSVAPPQCVFNGDQLESFSFLVDEDWFKEHPHFEFDLIKEVGFESVDLLSNQISLVSGFYKNKEAPRRQPQDEPWPYPHAATATVIPRPTGQRFEIELTTGNIIKRFRLAPLMGSETTFDGKWESTENALIANVAGLATEIAQLCRDSRKEE